MNSAWIVAANGSRARVFSQARPNQPLEEINDLVDEAVRLRTAETERDRLSSMAAAKKSSHNVGAAAPGKSYEPQQTPAEHEMESFARSIDDFLLEGYQQRRFQQLQLVASPEFLGLLRKFLDPQLKPLVKLEINKDYTHASAIQLREHLEATAE